MTVSLLFLVLLGLILISGFFSSSETGMMAVNRYKLRHLASEDHRGAQRVLALLERPDRLLGVILIGNTFANSLASMLALLLAKDYLGEVGWAITLVSFVWTLIVLIFAEIGPKTIAALHPQSLSFAASLPLGILLKLLYPLVWFSNMIVSGILRCVGIKLTKSQSEQLSADELRTVVREAAGLISEDHQQMLLSILDLEKVSVDDVMIPRNEIYGIDLTDDWEEILEQLSTCQYGRVPLFRDDIDQIEGILRVRDAIVLLSDEKLDLEKLVEISDAIYCVPEGTALTTQLLNFREEKLRLGIVVDEYGDVQGLVTLEDILEEIVGEFTTDTDMLSNDIHPQDDGSYLVDGGISVRELNRLMGYDFPINGPKTLSGLIIEHLQAIPSPQTSLKIGAYPIEVVKVLDNMVRTARLMPLCEEDGQPDDPAD